MRLYTGYSYHNKPDKSVCRIAHLTFLLFLMHSQYRCNVANVAFMLSSIIPTMKHRTLVFWLQEFFCFSFSVNTGVLHTSLPLIRASTHKSLTCSQMYSYRNIPELKLLCMVNFCCLCIHDVLKGKIHQVLYRPLNEDKEYQYTSQIHAGHILHVF